MGYPTDGSSHANGVANEHETVRFINEDSLILKAALCPDETMVQVGGTGTKVDAIVGGRDFTISIKNHKTGTFDWLNTTRYSRILDEAKEGLASLKNSASVTTKTEAERYRAPIAQIYRANLEKICSDEIREILSNCYAEYPDYVIINNKKKKEYILFESSKNMPELATFANWTYFLKFGKGEGSAQIWRRNVNGHEANTSLRLRLVLNNGLGPFFGVGEGRNTSSVPTFKIQQDGVKNFIDNLVDPIKETWS